MLWIALAMLLGGGAVAWWWLGQSDAVEPAAAPVASAPAVAPAMAVASEPAANPPDAGAADPSPTDTASLKQALGSQADGQQELQRVTSFLNFQRNFEKWQEMLEEPDPGPRNALAQKLIDELPLRVQQSEMIQPEAEFVCGILLSNLEPDEAVRAQKIEACNQKLTAVAPRADSEQARKATQCSAEYRRREAALVAEFQAKPQAQRNPQQLEAELNKAKRAVYDSPTCGL